MLVDEYITEEKKRLDAIKDLKAKGAEREAGVELESLKKWQRGLLGMAHGDVISLGGYLKLMRTAVKGEICQ